MILTTARLTLVPPAERHILAYTAFLASPRAAARGWQALPHEAWRHFAAILGHGILRGFGPFVAEERGTGRALGLFGPWWPEGQPEREVKWTLFDAADEGRGYALEAARACLSHVFGPLGWAGAVSYITPDNARSAALAQRLGAVQDGTWTTPRGTLVKVFRHAPTPLSSSPTRREARPEGQSISQGSTLLAPSPSWGGVGGTSAKGPDAGGQA